MPTQHQNPKITDLTLTLRLPVHPTLKAWVPPSMPGRVALTFYGDVVSWVGSNQSDGLIGLD